MYNIYNISDHLSPPDKNCILKSKEYKVVIVTQDKVTETWQHWVAQLHLNGHLTPGKGEPQCLPDPAHGDSAPRKYRSVYQQL